MHLLMFSLVLSAIILLVGYDIVTAVYWGGGAFALNNGIATLLLMRDAVAMLRMARTSKKALPVHYFWFTTYDILARTLGVCAGALFIVAALGDQLSETPMDVALLCSGVYIIVHVVLQLRMAAGQVVAAMAATVVQNTPPKSD